MARVRESQLGRGYRGVGVVEWVITGNAADAEAAAEEGVAAFRRFDGFFGGYDFGFVFGAGGCD